MKGKIISVFAGLGKTTVGNKYKNVCDLQSSPYRFDYSKVEKDEYEKQKTNKLRIINKEWPINYLNAILEAQKKYDIVLVPSNLDIRELLINNRLDFIFVLPSKDNEHRKQLVERYKQRGNTNEFIDEVLCFFDKWSRKQEDYNYSIVVLNSNQYLEDALLDMGLIKKDILN